MYISSSLFVLFVCCTLYGITTTKHLYGSFENNNRFILFYLQNKSHMLSSSILGALFPEAMIHYLENHGPDKFSEIFLGEFDTPEAIWNGEMR